MDPKLVTDRKKFFTLLQFLVSAQTLDSKPGSLGLTSYRQVVFQVHDFLKYTKQSQNHYQLKKLVGFFNQLQENSLITVLVV
jgi:hypothetical protein